MPKDNKVQNNSQDNKKKKGMLIAGIVLGVAGLASATAGTIVYVSKQGQTPVEYVTLTFNENGGKLDGTTVKVDKNQTFKDITKPRVIKNPEDKVLRAWAYDKDGKQLVKDGDSFDIDKTIYAVWRSADSHKLTFKSSDAKVHFEGEAEIFVDSNMMFKNINKPYVSKETEGSTKYTFLGWYYAEGQEKAGDLVQDTDTFNFNTEIEPHFKDEHIIEFVNLTFSALPNEPKTKDFDIRFNDIAGARTFTIKFDKSLKFNEINHPSATKVEEITYQSETFKSNYPFAKWVIPDPEDDQKYIPIPENYQFSQINNTVYAQFDSEPDILNSSYYLINTDQNNRLEKIIDGSESEGNIKVMYKDGDHIVIDEEGYKRSEFNYPVYFGKKITSISPNFLRDCAKFNQPITFTQNITFIGSGFLYGCSLFNQKIELTNTISAIGKCFMYGCYSMTNEVKLNTGLVTIDDYFMFYCNTFNKDVVIPNTVQYIGTSFMAYCTAFNSKLEFAAGETGVQLKTLLGGFLSYCSSFRQNLMMENCIRLTKIEDDFLFYADGYSGQVCLPNTIESIGQRFMAFTAENPQSSTTFQLLNFGDDSSKHLTALKTIGWGFLNHTSYNGKILLNNTVLTSIDGSFCRQCQSLNSQVSLPNSLTSIGDDFMFGCSKFNPTTPITLPEKLATVYSGMFYGCPITKLRVERTSWANWSSVDMFYTGTTVTIYGLTQTQFSNFTFKFDNDYVEFVNGGK